MFEITTELCSEVSRRALADEPEGEYVVSIIGFTEHSDSVTAHVNVKYYGKWRVQQWWRSHYGFPEEWPVDVEIPLTDV